MQVVLPQQVSPAVAKLKVQGMLQRLPRTRVACLQYQARDVITMCHHHVLSQSRRKRCHVLRFPSLNAFIMSARVLECMSGRLRYECVQMLQGHGTTSEPDICLTCVQTPQRYMNSEAQPICSFRKISRFLARSRCHRWYSPCKMLQLIQKLLRSTVGCMAPTAACDKTTCQDLQL